ncbi:MAG: hypothetical protein V4795_16910 [Pseudomonadota bacterium]
MAAPPLAAAVAQAPAPIPAPGMATQPAAVAPHAAGQAGARHSPMPLTNPAAASQAAPPQQALPGQAPSPPPVATAPAPAAVLSRADPAPDLQRTQLLQAAMQWVAAGEAPPEDDAGHLPSPAQRSAPSLVRMAGPITAESPGAQAQPVQALPLPTARPATAAPAMPASPAPERSHASPQAGPLPPRPRSELAEVSIGAIHLRIDAPAPPAPLRPAAPAPAAMARSGPPPTTLAPRSSLSRRALRRV